MKFRVIRCATNKLWFTKTMRQRYLYNDSISGTIECTWQSNYVSDPKMHSSVYCSIAEWNTHISDILCNPHYDNLSFDNDENRKTLFRHYTRTLLVVSEILSDFQSIIQIIKNCNQTDARKLMTSSSLPFSTEDLFVFVNSFCKHKLGGKDASSIKLHCFNHHCDYVFDDFPADNDQKLIVSIKSRNLSSEVKYSHIEMIKLLDIIDQVLYCYSITDSLLSSNYKDEIKENLRPFEKNIS